jgi:hypothetical protein
MNRLPPQRHDLGVDRQAAIASAYTRQLPTSGAVTSMPFVSAYRATHVPHRIDKPGIERTTTVTFMRPMSWSALARPV